MHVFNGLQLFFLCCHKTHLPVVIGTMNRMFSTLFLLLISVQAFSETITLQEYLSKVKEQSLELKIADSKLEVLDAKASGLTIPPPMVSFAKMNEADGNSATGFEVSQMIPFPTKISADYSARKYEFQAQQKNNLSLRKQTYLAARLIYLKLWESQERLAILNEKRTILKNHVKLSRAVTRSDSFASVHLLKTESDLDFLENEMESATQNILEKQLEAAVFINADPASFKFAAVDPKPSQVPPITSIEESNVYQAKLLGVESLKAKERKAKSEWLPDISLKYKEMGATPTSMKYNEFMIGVTLPFLFPWQPYAVSSLTSKERRIAEYELEKEKRNFGSDKVGLISRIESLRKQLSTLENKLIPKAEKRMKIAHNIVPRDMETLQDHRETMEAFPELKLRALEIRIDFENAVSALEKYSNVTKDMGNE